MRHGKLVYAIDFGTTNSLLAAAEPDRIHPPIELEPGAPDPTILRSVLYFPSMKECFYGTSAIGEFVARDMQGRLLRSIKKHLPIRSFIGTWIEERPVNLEDLIGYFLREMRARANAHFGADVDSVMLGRPARFSADDTDDQFAQYRLERAARLAGFKHVAFCPEPVAAAREYRSAESGSRTVLVADFGGGTSDFTVIRGTETLSIGGVAVAGDAFDSAIMRGRISRHFGAEVSYVVPFGSNRLTMPRHLMERICSPADISLLRDRDVMEFFRNVRTWSLGDEDRARMDALFSLIGDQLGFEVFERIEKTKRGLSEQACAGFRFEYPGISIDETITRQDFDELSRDQSRRILEALDRTVSDAGLAHADIDLVCCTGGTAKVAALRDGMTARFGGGKILQHKNFHSVVQGLAIKARELLD